MQSESLLPNMFDFLFSKKDKYKSLSEILDVSVESLSKYNKDNSNEYDVFKIAKRQKGKLKGKSYRIICSPKPELKDIQKRIYRRLLQNRKLRDSCIAYRSGKSIVDAARLHVGKYVIVKIDLKDFFENIDDSKVKQVFEKMKLPTTDIDLLIKLVTITNNLNLHTTRSTY